MRKAGVIGWPVSHSLSPRLHGYWLKKYSVDGSYEAIAVEPKNLETFIRTLKNTYIGANVTLPHKEVMLPLLDVIDDTAKAIGAVNTIVVKNGKLYGSNTDAYGFSQNLKQNGVENIKNKAVVLGAGGAARAAVKALADKGCRQIVIVNRTVSRAEAIAGAIGGKIDVVPWDNRATVLDGAELLVNATSLGLKSGAPLDIALEALPKQAAVMDMVYNPLETPLLAAARACGHKIVDGLGMLIWQAVPGFEAWFGVKPDVDNAIREQLLHAG
jgi:shikimate dehydrogenase